MMYLYAMQAENGGPIKVGLTRDPKSRRKVLQTGFPEKLIVLRSFPGSATLEKAVHARLRTAHQYGEWFVDCPLVHDTLDAAEQGKLWPSSDVGAAVHHLVTVDRLSLRYIAKLLGYSVEHVRQEYAKHYRQLNGCEVESAPLPPRKGSHAMTTGIDRAIEAAGGEKALGELLGVTQQAVNKMKRRGYCTLHRAEQIANNMPIAVEDLLDPEVVRVMKGSNRLPLVKGK